MSIIFNCDPTQFLSIYNYYPNDSKRDLTSIKDIKVLVEKIINKLFNNREELWQFLKYGSDLKIPDNNILQNIYNCIHSVLIGNNKKKYSIRGLKSNSISSDNDFFYWLYPLYLCYISSEIAIINSNDRKYIKGDRNFRYQAYTYTNSDDVSIHVLDTESRNIYIVGRFFPTGQHRELGKLWENILILENIALKKLEEPNSANIFLVYYRCFLFQRLLKLPEYRVIYPFLYDFQKFMTKNPIRIISYKDGIVKGILDSCFNFCNICMYDSDNKECKLYCLDKLDDCLENCKTGINRFCYSTAVSEKIIDKGANAEIFIGKIGGTDYVIKKVSFFMATFHEVLAGSVLRTMMRQTGIQNFGEIYGYFCTYKEEKEGRYLMEYLDGVTLKSLLEGDKLTLTDFKQILRQIFSALYIANYTYKFIHNDLHPSNIVILTDKKEQYRYKMFGTDYKVESKYLAKMIDFSYSFYNIENNRIIVDDRFKLFNYDNLYNYWVDHFKLLYSILNPDFTDLKNNEIKKWTNEIFKFTFGGDVESFKETTIKGYNKRIKPKVSVKDFIKKIYE